MRFLNPKTDYAFRKIFGSESSRDILVSFLNAILALSGEDAIVDVVILDPRLAPKIDGMKDTYLDVRVRDQRDRSYIVEMQVLRVEGFEKRILYNACKAYVNQLNTGDPYHVLTEVVAVTVTDFVMFPDMAGVVSRFRLRADENPLIVHRDLELVFAELPKFVRTEADLDTALDRWLYFIKTARDLSAIPQSLAVESPSSTPSNWPTRGHGAARNWTSCKSVKCGSASSATFSTWPGRPNSVVRQKGRPRGWPRARQGARQGERPRPSFGLRKSASE